MTRRYGNVMRGSWHGKWYDSSWELALIVYCEDHGIELTRNTHRFPYKYGRKIEYYQPDFILEDGTYVEVKGIRDRRSEAKRRQFPYPLQMWTRNDMKKYLDYMDSRYGSDWRMRFLSQCG